MRVLVVEDELKMAALLKQGLEEHDHSVTVVHDGLEAMEVVSSHAFDVVVLDVMLPGVDGFEVARRLRKNQKQVPILMLTARDAVPDITLGLDAGADDYLTKPFSFAELLARIRALGRRPAAMLPPQLSVGDLILDPGSRRVTRRDKEIRLTATEYRLLEFMMRRTGQVVPRELSSRRCGDSTKMSKKTPWRPSSRPCVTRSTVVSAGNSFIPSAAWGTACGSG